MRAAEAAFRSLLRALTAVYADEGRAGGDALAALLAEAAERIEPPAAWPRHSLDHEILAATEGADHPAAIAARAAHPLLRWLETTDHPLAIPERVSRNFAVCVLVGPDGLIPSQTQRAGLYMQARNVYYPLHAHEAEETYAMLAGSAQWTLEQDAPQMRSAGDLIHHPSNAAHATRTGATPILAAWRWSGDIAFHSYRMTPDQADLQASANTRAQGGVLQ